jgi:signal transduction histidine kinase/ActR/RegA family two-component response regulator
LVLLRPFLRGVPSATISSLLKAGPGTLRLRSKLLLSFVLLTAGLTGATLLIVHRNAQWQGELHMEEDVRHAALTFQLLQRQQEVALARKADLLASLAFLRNGDTTAVADAGNDPWQSEDCNLFVLADRNGKITALDSRSLEFPEAVAQEMLTRSLRLGASSGWWSSGRNLYQVVLQPFFEDGSRKNRQGYVVVGRLIDKQTARTLGKMVASDFVIRYGDKIAISTLSPFEEAELQKSSLDHNSDRHVELDGESYFAQEIKLAPEVTPDADLIVLKSYKELAAYLKRLDDLLLGLGFVTMLVGGLLIFIISDTITRPVASLAQGVRALERGDFAFPLCIDGADEVSRLTRAFQGMRATLQKNEAQREQLEGELRQAHKMEALGRLAGGVAHDFNNLLTVIRGHSELMLDRLRPGDPLLNHSQQIQKTADRASSLTRQLLAFSRRQVLQGKILDANGLITDMGKLLRRLVREDIELSLQLGESLGLLKVDPGQLEQVLLNLTVNASDAMPLGGKLTIETRNVVVDQQYAQGRPSLELGNYVLISVTDSGQGMDAATKARIFEPFFTTKEPGKGTGLGLATVYGVVKQSGGFIWVDSEPGKGARFEMYWPGTTERMEDSAIEAAKLRQPGGRRNTVLVVEDEKEVRELAAEFLKGAGYRVLTAKDGQDALETAERLGVAIQAVLTDVVMPKMRGPELGDRLKNLLPHLRIVYMTGYLEQCATERAFFGDALFLQKPFSRETLLRHMDEALQANPPVPPGAQTILH